MLGGVVAVPNFSENNGEIMLALVKKWGNLLWNLTLGYKVESLYQEKGKILASWRDW